MAAKGFLSFKYVQLVEVLIWAGWWDFLPSLPWPSKNWLWTTGQGGVLLQDNVNWSLPRKKAKINQVHGLKFTARDLWVPPSKCQGSSLHERLYLTPGSTWEQFGGFCRYNKAGNNWCCATPCLEQVCFGAQSWLQRGAGVGLTNASLDLESRMAMPRV